MTQELRNPESKLFMYFDEKTFYYECLPLICDVRLDKLLRLIDGEEENVVATVATVNEATEALKAYVDEQVASGGGSIDYGEI